jgi:hypothetical protein
MSGSFFHNALEDRRGLANVESPGMVYTRSIQNTARGVSMDGKELVTLNEMETGDPNRGLDKARIHMERMTGGIRV